MIHIVTDDCILPYFMRGNKIKFLKINNKIIIKRIKRLTDTPACVIVTGEISF